jgi:hypothetical protein
MMIAIELLKSDGPLAIIREWKQCHTVADTKRCLEELNEAVRPTCPSGAIQNVIDSISAKLGHTETFIRLYDHLFDYELTIDKHRRFKTNVMFRANFDFVPEKVFHDPSDSKHRWNVYLARFEDGSCLGEVDRMSACDMRFATPAKLYAPLEFHLSQDISDGVQGLFKQLLVKYADMDPEDALAMIVGHLYTRSEHMQPPHIDYASTTLEAYVASVGGERREFLPWSMDMPLTKGGMRLAFYGPYNAKMDPTPTMVHVPFRTSLFWRADCLHAGGFADIEGGPGFRMHAYIALNTDQYHTMLDNKPSIYTDAEAGRKFSEFVNKPDGTPIPRGNTKFFERVGHMSNPLCS